MLISSSIRCMILKATRQREKRFGDRARNSTIAVKCIPFGRAKRQSERSLCAEGSGQQGGEEALGRETACAGAVEAEQVECEAAQDGEVPGRVPGADAAGVLVEGDVGDQMPLVLPPQWRRTVPAKVAASSGALSR